MELMEAILTRRSVRQYINNKPINKDDILTIIKAGQYAPSAHNKQGWEFLVIEDKETLEKIRRLQRQASFAKDCGAVILLCANTEIAFSREKEGWSYEDIDCAACAQNMLLAAHSLGLGACWCGCSPMTHTIELTKQTFELPTNIKPFAFIVLGHKEIEDKQSPQRFFENKIHWKKW
ncbi:MAG: nitroreductase family protein [Alphaproteobacteria bacterium]